MTYIILLCETINIWLEIVKLLLGIVIPALLAWWLVKGYRQKQCGIEIKVELYRELLKVYSQITYTKQDKIIENPTNDNLCLDLATKMLCNKYLFCEEVQDKIDLMQVHKSETINGPLNYEYDQTRDSEADVQRILCEIRKLLLKELYINY